jgi:hypothetical protein
MKLYNVKLELIDNFEDLYTWQDLSIKKSLQKLLIEYNVCIIDSFMQSEINYSLINNSNIDIILYLMCDHPHVDEYNFLSELSKPIIYISWHRLTNARYQIIYPIWATITSDNTVGKQVLNNNPSKKYLYSCLTNKIRADRIVNLIEFHKSKYYNESLILFNARSGDELDDTKWNDMLYTIKNQFSSEYVNYFNNNIIAILPINTASSADDAILSYGEVTDEIIFNYSGAAYTNSYVNIAIENSYTDQFFSEKIFKPILAKQFFVIIAGKGSIALLRELGFDTYDDIIDHSRYDNSPDITRIQDVHALLHDMQHYDWEQIYIDTVERRNKNRQLLLDLTFEKKFLLELEQMITTIVKPT